MKKRFSKYNYRSRGGYVRFIFIYQAFLNKAIQRYLHNIEQSIWSDVFVTPGPE